MRFSKLFVAVLLFLGVAACNLANPTPEIIVKSPSEGQTFQIGQNVLISWGCEHCELFTSSSLKVTLIPNEGGMLPFSHDLGDDFLTGTKSWRAGTVRGGVVAPGLYFIVFLAECNTADRERTCGTQSGLFRLIR